MQANAPDPARDRRLVYAAAFVRVLATGMVGVLLGSSLATPLFVGAGMKITYDVLLGITFRRVLPPEER